MSRRQEDYVVQQARHCTNKSWGDWGSCINWCSSWWCRGTCWTTHIAAACTGHTETNRTDLIRYNYNHEQKSWYTFAFVRLFSKLHMPNSPTPKTTLETCVHIGRRVSTLYRKGKGWGKRKVPDIFKNVALFYESTKKLQKIMNTTSLSRGLLSRIVGHS